ncbi:GatB/YqeY domain-containing protein [Candidatus Saccharibacteria bacterium]|nr:GatB/YqeY domain-containing protein [Candidatus Saccharibacteria bacterium]
MLKSRIEGDLKTAMLSGDSIRVGTLKMVKSAILYKEVELDEREQGLQDEQVIAVLVKESKKRLEAATMYTDAGRTEQAAAEQTEFEIISEYLPAQMTDEELVSIVDDVVLHTEGASMKDMGKIIGAVKARAGATADGARIAALVKQKLQ